MWGFYFVCVIQFRSRYDFGCSFCVAPLQGKLHPEWYSLAFLCLPWSQTKQKAAMCSRRLLSMEWALDRELLFSCWILMLLLIAIITAKLYVYHIILYYMLYIYIYIYILYRDIVLSRRALLRPSRRLLMSCRVLHLWFNVNMMVYNIIVS